MTHEPTIWVLADDRAGNVSQCIGVAEALGGAFERKDIAYTGMARLPNALLGASLLGVQKASKDRLCAPWPDLVIGAGRRTAPIARFIKKQNGGKTKLVQIMHPGASGAADFDLIFVPSHDKSQAGENTVIMTGAPHRVTDQKLATATEEWHDRFSHLPSPKIALIVGGATKNKVFTPEMAKALGQAANQAAQRLNGSLLVTTSRRTGDAAQALINEVTVPSFIYQWGDEGENPYFGFLSCADQIIVTGDSVSMCSEACATGKPVHIYAPTGMISEKHSRMVSSLCEGGYAKMFDETLAPFTPKKLTTTQEIADQIRKLF